MAPCSDLREVVKVLEEHLRADGHSVHFVVEAVQEEAQEFLGVLLTAEAK